MIMNSKHSLMAMQASIVPSLLPSAISVMKAENIVANTVLEICPLMLSVFF